MQTNNLKPKKYTKIKLTIKDFTGEFSLGLFFNMPLYYTVYDDNNNVICPLTFVKESEDGIYTTNFTGKLDKAFILIELESLKATSYIFKMLFLNIENIDFMDTRVSGFGFHKGSLSSLSFNGINDIRTISITGSKTKEVSLSQCYNLRFLMLYQNEITSLDLSDLKNLEHLILDCSKFKAIDLSSLKNLRSLELSGNLNPLTFKELDITMLSNLNSIHLERFKDLKVYVTEKQKKELFLNTDIYWQNDIIKIIVK